jgi:hypothetical protein
MSPEVCESDTQGAGEERQYFHKAGTASGKWHVPEVIDNR